ncbi:spore coat protein [Paenibacillus sp. NPDC057967]|uniref:spore coat protein n=1 Tax=Paenibacillus sp. NPDC057967 TaxID=3346293 RepID=UPI0036DE670D
MAAHLGAHETMEVHEVLSTTITIINTMQLYRPYAKDPRLTQILDKQLQFTIDEYNRCVQAVQHLSGRGAAQGSPYAASKNFTPTYGLDHPSPASPNASANQIDDRDVACALLGLHKSSASMKIIAALECANPQLRSMMQQGAVNCSEQAYEVWQYMNQAGYYQVPTMKEITTNTILNHYQPATINASAMGLQGNFYQRPATMTYPAITQ